MNLLVLRFSAMGDVALAQPVVKQILDLNPKVHITFVTKPQFEPFFAGLPRFTFYGADLKGEYTGVMGLFRLQQKLLSTGNYDYVIDLHDVVRTWILCFLCAIKGIPYKRIDKGRLAKKKLTRKSNKIFKPLKHTTQRYLETFSALGLSLADIQTPSIDWVESGRKSSLPKILEWPGLVNNKNPWIGVAPFAKHKQKQWPIEKMHMLIKQLTEQKRIPVFLFGGKEEADKLETIAGNNELIFNLAGKLSLKKEMELIKQLDLMMTMDSFNMHLASLLGVKTISIWGATHPNAGFGPLGDNKEFIIQIPNETLSCRPCSVFGNRVCWRGDFACMQKIEPEIVMQKVALILKNIEGNRH